MTHLTYFEKLNHHSKADTFLKLILNSQFLQNYYSRSKMEILTWQVKDRILDRVSEPKIMIIFWKNQDQSFFL